MPASSVLLVANQPKPWCAGVGPVNAPESVCGAVVLMVSVGVPEPFASEAALKVHVGAGVPAPATVH
jgi:hypothetical protein